MNKKSKREAESSSFERMFAELTEIVQQLEEGQLSLDESLAKYEQGIRFLGRCQKILTSAERKIEVLQGLDAEGNPLVHDFDDEQMSLTEKAERRSRRRSVKKRQQTKPAGPPHRADAQEDDVDAGGRLF